MLPFGEPELLRVVRGLASRWRVVKLRAVGSRMRIATRGSRRKGGGVKGSEG